MTPRGYAVAAALGVLLAGCGYKGPLTLPEETGSVIIRPAPQTQQPTQPQATPSPAPQATPPPSTAPQPEKPPAPAPEGTPPGG